MAKTKTQAESKTEEYIELVPDIGGLSTPKVGRAGAEVDPSKPLSGAIRRALAGTGLSSYQIAAKVGITPPAMHRFLTGERGLSLEMLDRLIVAMELEVSVRPKSGA